MGSLLAMILPLSVALGRGIDGYDTSISLTPVKSDSFYIHPLGKHLHFGYVTTASCPSFSSGDFVLFGRPEPDADIEKIPALANPLIHITAHCAGSESTGIKADTGFSFADRYYKVNSASGDVFFRVTEISDTFVAHLEFGDSPFPTGINHPRRSGAGGGWKRKFPLERNGSRYGMDGKRIPATQPTGTARK